MLSHIWGRSQRSPRPRCSLPLTLSGGSALRAVCAVLSGLLGPEQSPISCALFGLWGDLQRMEEFGSGKLLFAPVRSAWVTLPSQPASTECCLSFLLQKSLNETFGADKYSEARKEVLTNMFSRPMQVRIVPCCWTCLAVPVCMAPPSTLSPSALP